MSDALRSSHHAESIFSQDFADIGFRMAAAQQGFGYFWEFRGVLHAGGHERALEIGSQANMRDAGERYGMLDVFDDFFRGNLGQLSPPDKSVAQLLPFRELARLLLSEFFLDRLDADRP